MRFTRGIAIWVFALVVGMIFAGAGLAQDLNQQKQQKLKKINEIDAKIKAGASADEYDSLIQQRKKLVNEVEALNKKLMADAESMKRLNSMRRAYNEGLNALKLGQYSTAISHFENAIGIDSTFAEAHYAMGLALKRDRSRKITESNAAYRTAIRLNPALTNAYVNLGKNYDQMGRYDDAINTLLEGTKADPSSAKAFYELGAVYQNRKKDYNKAAQYFTKATQLNPEYDLAYYGLGVSLTELGRFEEALIALDTAAEVTKRRRWEDPWYRMAVIYNKQGRYSDAKSAAEKALQAQGNYAPAAYEAGKASKALGNTQEALAFFRTAAKNRVWKQMANYEIDLIVNADKYGGN